MLKVRRQPLWTCDFDTILGSRTPPGGFRSQGQCCGPGAAASQFRTGSRSPGPDRTAGPPSSSPAQADRGVSQSFAIPSSRECSRGSWGRVPIGDSTPPKRTRPGEHAVLERPRRASSMRSPFSVKDTMPPKSRICAAATACPHGLSSPSRYTRSTPGCSLRKRPPRLRSLTLHPVHAAS